VNGKYICSRQVNSFYDLKRHETIAISAINKPLFLTFIKFESKGEDYRYLELMRHGFKIEWE
jgi:hypothetical protein